MELKPSFISSANMPVNPLKYTHDYKDVLRPEILKRDNYKCTKCGIPNKTRYITDPVSGWLAVDAEIEAWAITEKVKISKSVLTIAHLNQLTFDNRFSNLKTLCSVCHLAYDREFKASVKVLNSSWNADEIISALLEKGGVKLIPHAMDAARVLGRRSKTLENIYVKRHRKGYDSFLDKTLMTEVISLKKRRKKLLEVIAGLYEKILPGPVTNDFVAQFIKNEDALIGVKMKSNIKYGSE